MPKERQQPRAAERLRGVSRAPIELARMPQRVERTLKTRLKEVERALSGSLATLDGTLKSRFAALERSLEKRLQAVEQGGLNQITRLDYAGAEVYLGTTTRRELLGRARSHYKEPWTVQWIEESVGEGDVLYDVGANVGAYSLIAARRMKGGHVVAFEPGYANYAALCDNVMLNELGDTITALPVVLADVTALDALSYSDVSAGAAFHTIGEARYAEAQDPVYRQAVLGYRLDDLVERFELPPPNHIKIDVDGAEAAVLAGATRALERAELKSVLVEVDRELTDEITSLLSERGLSLRERIDERASGKPLRGFWYGIFSRGEPG